jgi:hypothetical protein
MCTFEEWKHCRNSWSIAEFCFTQGLAKVKCEGACWRSLTSIINHLHNLYKCIKRITNIGLGVKLTNSMSFGESVFSVGFIQKTGKEDLFVKANHVYPQRNQCGKTLEDYRRQTTEAEGRWLPCGPAGPIFRPLGPLGPPVSPSFECRFSTAS